MIRSFVRCAAATLFAAGFAVAAHAQTDLPTQEGDYIAKNFQFHDGGSLPSVRLHYTTLGTPVRDGRGRVTNAVLILHGTGGDGHQFLRPQFSGVLFVPGGLLDIKKYYIILPDGLGHGKSSKPSDGLHAKFPQYDYEDMVAAQYLLVTKGLHVNHLRLVMGTSMGCMQSFMWGEAYPDFMDALMPLACEPVQIAGRNRMWRRMVIDAIKNDPAWEGGEYKTEPQAGLRVASDMLLIAGSAPLLMQKEYGTRDTADAYLEDFTAKEMAKMDANDFLYQVSASRDYDPSAKIGDIKAHVMWINSADDFINPPELTIPAQYAPLLKHGQYVLIPISDKTHGHGTHTLAAVWQNYMAELLKESEH